ncbi:hypothetical protein ACFSVK_23820 [Azorhizophilus paspali]
MVDDQRQKLLQDEIFMVLDAVSGVDAHAATSSKLIGSADR